MVDSDFSKGTDSQTSSNQSANPYTAPGQDSKAIPNELNGLLWRAVFTIIGSMILVGVLGACGGMLIGTLSPSYYEMLFPNAAMMPSFNPVRFGLALGGLQGVGVGFLVGSVAVFAVAFYRSRVRRQV